MAYDTSERFPQIGQSLPLLDPGSYQFVNSPLKKPNKVPFLSKCPRETQTCYKIWTHALYYSQIGDKIPNCTSFLSKAPRLAYEKWSDDEVAENEAHSTCQCGIQDSCECAVDEKVTYPDETKAICQAKFQRRLFKGATLRSLLGEGLACPSKRDYGFQILPDNSRVRMFKKGKEDCPPFYDTRIIESNSFYRGCKWSRHTSRRTDKTAQSTPGPADYYVYENRPSYDVICTEKLRAFRRKTSKQLRFLDKVQRQNVLEALPGPASYSPTFPTGTNLKFLGSKAKRFMSPKSIETPDPTRYFIKRDFDVTESLDKPCHAKLPPRAPFGVRDRRFKYKFKEGPSPASYDTHYAPCQLMRCRLPPFGSSSKRFNDIPGEDSDNIIYNNEDDTIECLQQTNLKHLPTWEFRSKTVRMKPLTKNCNEPSPADLPQPFIVSERSFKLQHSAPFFSSEARFQSWYNSIPIHANEKTPGPAYYNPEGPNCLPSVKSGPLCRSQRFTWHPLQTPAPNEYKPEKGIVNILKTYNQRLKNNIAKKHIFQRKSPKEPKKLGLKEQELRLLNRSIALLDVPDIFEYNKLESKKMPTPIVKNKSNQKLLRYFMYVHQVKRYF